jgi:hypothetical protein
MVRSNNKTKKYSNNKNSNKKINKLKGGSRKKLSQRKNNSKKSLSKSNKKKSIRKKKTIKNKRSINLKGGSKKKKSINKKKKISKKKKSKNVKKRVSNKKGGNSFKGVVQALQAFEHQDDEGKNKQFNNKICSPHLNNNQTQFTCFTHDSLKKIAKSYNKNYQENKNFSIDNKQKLWEEIKDSLKNQCGDNEVCWKNQNFVQQINDEQIDEYTFKPKIPKKKYEWLKTSDINKVLVQYQKKYKDFLFLGTVPIDFDDLFKEFKKIKVNELMNNNINKLGVVFNLDPHWKGGSHWVCMFAKLPHSIEYFDSYGDDNDEDGKPPTEIKTFMDRLSGQIDKSGGGNNKSIQKHNRIRHQFANSECGVYCLNYIIERLSGRSFEEITGNITKDEVMNQNRKNYFRE